MYCRKCGKFIDYDADFCDECVKAQQDSAITGEPVETVKPVEYAEPVQPTYQQPTYQQPNYQQPPYPNPNYQVPNYQAQQPNQPYDYGYQNYNQAPTAYYDYNNPNQPKDSKSLKKNGFGKALAGTILGAIGFIIAYFIIIAIGEYLGYDYAEIASMAVVGFVFTLPAGIISLVFGVKSINTFKATNSTYKVKPVPTLVLGIVATVAGAITILFDFCFFIILFV